MILSDGLNLIAYLTTFSHASNSFHSLKIESSITHGSFGSLAHLINIPAALNNLVTYKIFLYRKHCISVCFRFAWCWCAEAGYIALRASGLHIKLF